ncbi:nicotinate-nucleotide--dimethylbenzimidazole phosphoribosyltransferase [Inmirania thermothiophila]|uniref:Nicotinate-nucleotide--dimethylbenzimidazole phosphoribosyltransferase n=1 Tax=Inmirania thermothiophila TaxID=1750597 RepID=A0A3N1XZM4_9GAMM|nr:nicotinate-nucleotide--dimethylbenzimidazole phosphoribosyltransferase [Inmirania thermothiophila]ROR32053.1 nicotinate-nucleotide-dimethylbenzimidazole phosphoribosyltransferase [Inmirania thermothiophila]
MSTTAWTREPVRRPDAAAGEAARLRQQRLTKPPGSLGRLETLAVRLAALQGRARPRLDRVRIVVFAADHGVAEEGVSAFPQAVTVEMIRNFARGGAAISVLARTLGASLEVVDVGAAADPGPLPGVVAARQGAGTANFTRAPAMTPGQLAGALGAGREAVARAREAGCDLFVAGEMGIANTTVAAALTAALLDLAPDAVAGRGTGVDDAGLARKVDAIRRALALHRAAAGDPMEALRRLGGFEIAAIAGAYIACAQAGIPAVVDGFIAGAAALAAVRVRPEVRPWLLFGHRSAEGGHARLLAALGAEPVLDLGMRLGEGTGAAASVAVLRLACALHDGMATFEEAGVSGGPA